MTRNRLCVHGRFPHVTAETINLENLLAQTLRRMGCCPDCPATDGKIKLAALRSLQAEIPSPFRIGLAGIEGNQTLANPEIGALAHVHIDRTHWKSTFAGNLGVPWHFVSSFLGLEGRQLKFHLRSGHHVLLKRNSIKQLEVIIPAAYAVPDQTGSWRLKTHGKETLNFNLTPAPVEVQPKTKPQPILAVA